MDSCPLVTVTGVITFSKSRNNVTNFRILCPNMGKTFDGECTFFCPLRVNDSLTSICKLDPDGKLHVALPPFVQPPMSKEALIACFCSCLRVGQAVAIRLYRELESDSKSNVVYYLSDLAQRYNDTGDLELIYKIKSIEEEQTRKLFVWWFKERNLRRLYLLGLNKKLINACRMTCEEIYDTCMDNPYKIPAIPPDKCEEILTRLGKESSDDDKLRGAIVRLIWKNLHTRSWVCTPSFHISKQYPQVAQHIGVLKSDYGVIAELHSAYLKFPHTVETSIADFIEEKVKNDPVKYDTPLDTVIELEDGTKLERISPCYNREMSEDQQKAIQGALDHKLCIITGGPGTGKTTVLSQITYNLELRGISYAVCSFTGKAVARIREVTKKRNPATMHRLITNTRKNFLDHRNPKYEDEAALDMNYTHVIIDECSMVTTELLYDFIQSFPKVEKLTLIGDCNQLPPIGWGNLFGELIQSERVPIYKLSTSFRVYTVDGELDGITHNCNAMIRNTENFEFRETTNFSVYEGPLSKVYDVVKAFHRSNIPVETIVVLVPYNRYLEELNKGFQEIYNSNSDSVTDSRGYKWALNDRVMLLDNDHDIGVYNGEIGSIRKVTPKSIDVDFGEQGCHEFLLEPKSQKMFYSQGTSIPSLFQGRFTEEVYDGYEGDYQKGERTVMKLRLAYAMTPDKAQGSEWNFVIFCIPEFTNGGFLNRNRIYTAISRAKRACFNIVSDTELFQQACRQKLPYRCERLGKRLMDKLEHIEPWETAPAKPEREIYNNYDPDYDPDDDIPDYFD